MADHALTEPVAEGTKVLLARRIRERLRLRLGPNALSMAQAGADVTLNPDEADQVADVALEILTELGLAVVHADDSTLAGFEPQPTREHQPQSAAQSARQRYADAVSQAECEKQPKCSACIADAVLAVRDAELEQLRADLAQCNGLCLRASDVLDDMSRVNGNPVARAHRSCPLHGDLEAAAWELDAALTTAEATLARVAAFRDYLATATADTETGALLLKVAASLRDVLDGEHVPAVSGDHLALHDETEETCTHAHP